MKPIMRIASCIFAALLCVPSLAQTATPAQVQSSTLRVRVTDQLGAVIGKAFVLLHSDALERENPKSFTIELRTSSEGEAKGVLPSGFYDLFIASTGFAPHCEKLRVRDGKPATVKVVLRVDKLMSNEYGDRFEK
jgi:hypothetical protein